MHACRPLPDAGRRRLLAGACVLASAQPWRVDAAPVLQTLGKGAWLLPGLVEDPAPANGGRVHNTVVLAGHHGSVVVDPGATLAQGRALQRLLRTQGLPPVAALVLTHPHPENVLAASAFPASVPVLATAPVAEVMRGRCPQCLARLRERVGAASDGTGFRLPDRVPAGGEGVQDVAGRRLRWWNLGVAHSAADSVWLDEDSGVMAAGGVLHAGCVPELLDSDLTGWLRAQERMAALPVRLWVPAQGKALSRNELAPAGAYLQALHDVVSQDVEAGNDPATAAQRLALPAFAGLALHATRHAFNVQRAWRQIENASFGEVGPRTGQDRAGG